MPVFTVAFACPLVPAIGSSAKRPIRLKGADLPDEWHQSGEKPRLTVRH